MPAVRIRPLLALVLSLGVHATLLLWPVQPPPPPPGPEAVTVSLALPPQPEKKPVPPDTLPPKAEKPQPDRVPDATPPPALGRLPAEPNAEAREVGLFFRGQPLEERAQRRQVLTAVDWTRIFSHFTGIAICSASV